MRRGRRHLMLLRQRRRFHQHIQIPLPPVRMHLPRPPFLGQVGKMAQFGQKLVRLARQFVIGRGQGLLFCG